MKAFLFALCASLLLAGGAMAQLAPTDGVLGAAWGSSRTDVIAVMAARPGVKHEVSLDKGDSIFFSGGQIAGYTVLLYAFRFVDDRLYSASVIFPPDEHHFLDCYSQVIGLLQEKYGKPSKDSRLYKYPYDKLPPGSFDDATAFKAGKGLFLTAWEMPSTKQKDAVVWCTITDDLNVKLTYEKESLEKLAESAKRASLKNDL